MIPISILGFLLPAGMMVCLLFIVMPVFWALTTKMVFTGRGKRETELPIYVQLRIFWESQHSKGARMNLWGNTRAKRKLT